MCSFSACSNSNWVLRVTTSCLNSTKCLIISFRFNTTGRPLQGNIVDSIRGLKFCMYKRLFNTTLGFASLLNSYTTLYPFLSDSSLISEMPSIFLSFTRSAVFNHVCLIHLIRHLGNHNLHSAIIAFFNHSFGT